MRAEWLRLNAEHPCGKKVPSGEEFDERQRIEETQITSRVPRPKLAKDRSMLLQDIDAFASGRRLRFSVSDAADNLVDVASLEEQGRSVRGGEEIPHVAGANPHVAVRRSGNSKCPFLVEMEDARRRSRYGPDAWNRAIPSASSLRT